MRRVSASGAVGSVSATRSAPASAYAATSSGTGDTEATIAGTSPATSAKRFSWERTRPGWPTECGIQPSPCAATLANAASPSPPM